MKLVFPSLTLLFLFATTSSNSQSISCQDVYDYVVENYDYTDSASCYGSSMLVKVKYYKLSGQGYVVAYIKKNDYDFNGRPYIFCGIPNQRWNAFKIEGAYYSWGKKFHEYIMDHKCSCY